MSYVEPMKSHGYVVLNQYLQAQQLAELQIEAERLIARHYTQENLLNHSVYPSDESEARVSHAMMIAEGQSEFPQVDHSDCPQINQLLKDHNALLSDFTQAPVPGGARCMVNYQCYESGSKPVGEHFDGEYLRTQRSENGIDFELLEGILPRYVSLLVVSNDNDGRGIELIDADTVIKPTLHAGDMIVFDNVRWRHRVPKLEHGRISMGMRNFDHMPWHYAATPEAFLGEDSDYMPIHSGWGSTSVDSAARLKAFFSDEWPELKKSYSHYF